MCSVKYTEISYIQQKVQHMLFRVLSICPVVVIANALVTRATYDVPVCVCNVIASTATQYFIEQLITKQR